MTQETEDVVVWLRARLELSHDCDPEAEVIVNLRDLRDLSDRIDVLEDLLADAREALALGAAVPPLDLENQSAVVSLGDRIGYGALMATASVEWRSRLGELAGSEFCAGPCRSTAEKVIERISAALHQEGIDG